MAKFVLLFESLWLLPWEYSITKDCNYSVLFKLFSSKKRLLSSITLTLGLLNLSVCENFALYSWYCEIRPECHLVVASKSELSWCKCTLNSPESDWKVKFYNSFITKFYNCYHSNVVFIKIVIIHYFANCFPVKNDSLASGSNMDKLPSSLILNLSLEFIDLRKSCLELAILSNKPWMLLGNIFFSNKVIKWIFGKQLNQEILILTTFIMFCYSRYYW